VELERQITVMVGRVANKVFPKYQQDDGVQDKQATWEEARVALNLNHRRVQSARDSSNCLSSFLSSLLNPRSSFSKRSFAKTGSGQCKKDWGKTEIKEINRGPLGFAQASLGCLDREVGLLALVPTDSVLLRALLFLLHALQVATDLRLHRCRVRIRILLVPCCPSNPIAHVCLAFLCRVHVPRHSPRQHSRILLSCQCGRRCCCVDRREGIYLISTFLALKICRVYLLLELSMEFKLETVSVGSTAAISSVVECVRPRFVVKLGQWWSLILLGQAPDSSDR
jgi:hypothetical protein